MFRFILRRLATVPITVLIVMLVAFVVLRGSKGSGSRVKGVRAEWR